MYSFQRENELRTLLFENQSYNMFSRPSATVDVQVSLNIINFNDLNIKEQQLTTTAYFLLTWRDDRLFWDNIHPYRSDVTILFTSEEYVWHPSVVVDNSISDISAMSDSGSPIAISTKGILTWRISGIFDTYCDIDTLLYPFDTQTCSISMTSLAYSLKEVDLAFRDTPVDAQDLHANGEWIYIGFRTSRNLVSREVLTYSALTFGFQLKRRPLYHILNTLVPTISLAFLTCMVFKLPVDSGEKIGYSLTVVLSYAVYLTLVADNIPSSSTTVSVLSIYIISTLILGMLSVVLTIIVIRCHHSEEDKPVPNILQQVCRTKLKEMFCERKNHRQISDAADATPKAEADRPSSVTVSTEDMTWQDAARALDHFFFRLYFVIVFLGTFSLVITLTVAS
ncbi:acetylcholine receptor subunit beta-like [Pecten maximus]|uniref:acetylcholine receptor subunit beta-like n=1 Tax=Pecten maximus TaxID=6579 RepID=UPI001458C54E|nr:acetylcholine receptor subunit beta-like [Pecten maximus]